MSSNERQYPRHTSDLPVAVTFGEVLASESTYLNDISAGGVGFNAMVPLEPGAVLILQLPPGRPVLSTPIKVVWCRQVGLMYAVGAEFLSKNMTLRERIVEMVQQIEDYRSTTAREGRSLSAQHAALEWIDRFGKDFFSAA